MAQKIGDVVKGLTQQIAYDAQVPESRISNDPVYRALVARIVTLEQTIVLQAEQIGRLTVAVESLEATK